MAPENPKNDESAATYWYHPESDSYWIHNPAVDPPLSGATDEALSTELTEYEYVARIIERIDADPEHKLPEGVSAVIKNAYTWPGNKVSGFIWYDMHKRFINGYPINTSEIISREPGGIFHTKNSKYLVHIIQPAERG